MRRALTLPGTVFAAALTACALGAAYSSLTVSITPHWNISNAPPMTDLELGVTLQRVGLDAESLAAGGVSAQQCTSLVKRARKHLVDHIQQLRSADMALQRAQGERDDLMRTVNSGLANGTARRQYAEAERKLASAEAHVARELDAFRSAALDGMASSTIRVLSIIESNRRWTAPTYYKTVERTEPDWIRLRNSLASGRIVEGLGDDMPSQTMMSLRQFDADPTVSASRTNVELNLEAVTLAWETAVGLTE